MTYCIEKIPHSFVGAYLMGWEEDGIETQQENFINLLKL
jgi:hypothetical protein